MTTTESSGPSRPSSLRSSEPKPWDRSKGEKDWKDLIPGYAGYLDDEQVERIQDVLHNDDALSYWWGWKPGMRRRATLAIRRVAMHGDPENRSHNVRLVREAGRRPNADSEQGKSRVTIPQSPAKRPGGRPRKSSWESELVKLSKDGLGVKRIAEKLKAEGHEVSHMTVSRRLAELTR
jgi:hypothetical protein